MSSSSYRQQLKNIKSDVGKIASNLAKGLAERAEKDLIKAHDQIIDNYYQAHNPSSYNRKHNLYNALINHTIKKRNRTIGGKVYTASVTVGNTDMNDIYRASTETVFDLVWNKGVRGLPHHGNTLLTKSWTNPITGIHYSYEGENWLNPYWSGKSEPYHNIFTTSIKIGTYTTKVGIPNNVMKDLVTHWWQANGDRTCDELINKMKN